MKGIIQHCASLSEPTSVAGYFGVLPCAAGTGAVVTIIVALLGLVSWLIALSGWAVCLMGVTTAKGLGKFVLLLCSRISKELFIKALKVTGIGVAVLLGLAVVAVMFAGLIVMSPRHSSYWLFSAILCGIAFLGGGLVGRLRAKASVLNCAALPTIVLAGMLFLAGLPD